MAVSEFDKKHLSTVQQREIDRVTKAAQSGSMSWDQAHQQAEAIRSKAGYSGGSAGVGYVRGPVTPTPVPYKPPATTSGYTPGPSTDYASEIVKMLTSGAPVDYDRLNSLASARDSKMGSDPSKFGQFESTSDIINRYLPAAQKAEEAYNKQKQSATEIDSLIELLKGIGGGGVNRMSFEEAKKRAEGELNPMYQQASQQLSESLNADMERRGIYNSPLASGIMTEKQGKLTNEQIAQIAQRANTLIQNDAELSLQEKQLQSSTLNSLLSTLIGRQFDEAKLTGIYNGSNTLNRDKFESDQALAEGELTGNYKGKQTLDSIQLDLQRENSRISSILSQVQLMGKVTTQEQADALGVPIGASTFEAQNAAAERQQEIRMFNREMSLKQASLAASNAAQSASGRAQKFNDAMKVWETTGKAPTGILQEYGVPTGTAWGSEYTRSAQGKLEEVQAQVGLYEAEEELNFQNRATGVMKTYGCNRSVAEAMLLIVDQADTYDRAKSILSTNKKALEAEGISTANLLNILGKYYNVSGKFVRQDTLNSSPWSWLGVNTSSPNGSTGYSKNNQVP